jgi:uncharacterized protein
MNSYTRTSVSFFSEGNKICGHIYMPTPMEHKLPAIILCHGFAGIKEFLLPKYAEFFAKSGFVVLAFDYSGFGESEGPRGKLVPAMQVTDIKNAITYMQYLPEVDEDSIALWGTSFGGANAITAASTDKRVRAMVVQLTFSNGERLIKSSMDREGVKKLERTLAKAWEREVIKNKPVLVSPTQILTDDESKAFYEHALTKYPALATKIPITTLRHILKFKPVDYIQNIDIPIMIIAAKDDAVCPFSESEELYDKANTVKQFVALEDIGHYQVYEKEYFKKSADAAIQWFESYLATHKEEEMV